MFLFVRQERNNIIMRMNKEQMNLTLSQSDAIENIYYNFKYIKYASLTNSNGCIAFQN